MKKLLLILGIALIGLTGFSQVQNPTLSKGLIFDPNMTEAGLLAGDDLVTNGDMSATPTINGVAPSYFTSSGNITSGYLEVTSTATGSTMRIIPNDATMNSKYYDVNYWVYMPSSNTSLNSLNIQVRIDGVDVTLQTVTGQDKWIKVNYRFKNGSTPSTDRVILIETGTTTSGDIYRVDNMVIRELDQSTYDRISGASLEANNVTHGADQRGNGQKYYDFNGTTDAITSISNVIGDGDFTCIIPIKTGAIGTEQGLLGGLSGSFGLAIAVDGKIIATKVLVGNVSASSSTALVADTDYVLAYTKSGATATYYFDGLASGTATDALDYSVATTFIGKLRVANEYFNGDIKGVYLFNHALDASTVSTYSTAIADGTFLMPASEKGADNAEQVTDGNPFVAGSWTLSNASVVGGELVCTSVSTEDMAYQNASIVTGKTYLVTYTVSGYTSGAVRTIVGGTNSTPSRSANGTYAETITTTASNGNLYISSVGSFNGTVDNISVVELGSTLTLPPSGMSKTAWRDIDHDEIYSVDGPEYVIQSYDNALLFDGSTSNLVLADEYFDGTKPIVAFGWFNARSLGENNLGTILSNGSLIIRLSIASTSTMRCTSDGSTNTISGLIDLNTPQFFAIVRNGASEVTYYLGDNSTAPAISGTENQASGAISDGGDLYVGDISGGGQAFDGVINDLRIYNTDLITGDIEDFILLYYNTYK